MAPPARNTFRTADARIWMWEAWRGAIHFNIEHYYRDSLFGARSTDENGYARAVASVLSSAQQYPVVILQTTEQKMYEFESLLRNARKKVENLLRNARKKVEILAPHPYEVYLVGTN